MDIGIFSGSFNPIHVGHLALANYLCEFGGLDELWFLVTPRNPFKVGQDLLPDALRLELVQLAVEGYPKFRASDFEFHLSQPSYTIHTFDRLKEVYPQHTFHLIIGSDNWHSFSRWYQSERLLAENPILIYPRSGLLACVWSIRLYSKSALPLSESLSRQGRMYAISSILACTNG